MSSKRMKITSQGSFRAQVVHLGAPDQELAPGESMNFDGQPLVAVTLLMPLTDARRFGSLLYEWVELSATIAEID